MKTETDSGNTGVDILLIHHADFHWLNIQLHCQMIYWVNNIKDRGIISLAGSEMFEYSYKRHSILNLPKK